eukprot:35893-Hanusia_phi.AAC.1
MAASSISGSSRYNLNRSERLKTVFKPSSPAQILQTERHGSEGESRTGVSGEGERRSGGKEEG